MVSGRISRCSYLTAVCAHLVMSGGQTLFHYGLGHHRMGGVLFRNHIRFHHRYYARGRLVSPTYRGEEGNNTPYFLIPTMLMAAIMFYVLPLGLFLVAAATSAASFYAHVYLDKEYHRAGTETRAFCLVPAQAAASFRPPPARRQQFRSHRFLLGQIAWHLSTTGRCWAICAG